MNLDTSLAATLRILCVGLFVLAGALVADAHRASAQTQEACPLPAGVTPPADPRVTAQQVEDGSATLMEFAIAAREQLRQGVTTTDEAFYIGCILRQEGSPWRSGSTYLVQLAPDRIFFHAKAMALSGRLLNPLIYGAILRALGINLADLADPASALAAFAGAAAGNGGSFNVPDVPGASGYATVYLSPNFPIPLVLLAGFDLDESHLAQEDIDSGAPSITARDVVDRETLKAFVTQAGEFFLEHQTSGDLAALSKAKIALRDPNGPWRHGSVYLYILDRANNIVLFHATEPDRFELFPLVGQARDGVTGELILPQVLAAATSNPEGGFVQYYYDDPADDTDRADIPKVGYARQFTGEIRAAERVIPVDFIIGSGIYLSSPEVVAASRNTVVKSVLPQIMRAMTASTVDAVSGRIEQATSRATPPAGFSFGGASTLSDIVLANGPALENGTFDLSRLLAGSSFTLALDDAGGRGSGPFGNLTLWGSGDYRSIAGGNPRSVNYDGSVVSANLGIDTKLGAGMLAGVAVSQAQGTVDYTDLNAQGGELSTSVTSVNPYLGWGSAGGLSLWAAAGYGTGEVEIVDSVDADSSDLSQQMLAVGASGPLMVSDEMFEGGTTSLRLKGEAAFTKAEIDGSRTLESMSLSASRQRLTLEGVYDRKLASGATLSPSLELGMRNDGGDGETGTGIETGGGLRYSDAATGLTVEGRARTLLSHSGDYEEWGVSGLVRIDPGGAGQGLALSLQPAWGRTASGVQRLWEHGLTGGLELSDHVGARVNARVAYGIGTVWGGQGMLTPYTDVSLSEEGYRRLSLGGRYDIGPTVRMSLEGVHSQPAHGATDRMVMLRGHLNW